MIISQKIVLLRKQNHLSQDELAESLHVSRQSLHKWEKGTAVPQTEKVLELAKLFKISVDVLIDDEIELQIQDNKELIESYQPRYLNTNGYRGEANKELTSDIAYKIGRFLGWYYSNPKYNQQNLGHKAKIVVGKDTRRSSYMFEYAIAGGAASSGADVYMMHVTTTPSIGFIVGKESFDCGVMVTASHNPSFDNGIKLISADGELIDNTLLYLLEAYLDNDLIKLGIDGTDLPFAKRSDIGIITDFESGRDKYINYLISLSKYSFRDLKIGLDTGNGASYMIAKTVFESLGAQLYIINDKPDGLNINEGVGSTHIEKLCKYVKDNKLDVGFAFDGDADRCIAVDENGNEVNGDKIIYLIANKLKREGALDKDTVVITEISNTGLIKALKNLGIKITIADVGSRYVLEKMIKGNYSFGGEQSGHILTRKYASTSDGIIAALLIVEEIIENKQQLSELIKPVKLMPQVIKSIRVDDSSFVLNNHDFKNRCSEVSKELGDNGRLLVRASNTESLVRIMVECKNNRHCGEVVDSLSKAIDSLL